MQVIPITNTYRQSFKTSLGGQNVKLTFWYQAIGSGWFCSMEYPVGTPIFSGKRVNSGSPLLQSVFSDFEGDIVAVPTIAPYYELGQDPWDNTHVLMYITGDEVEGA